MASYIRIGYPGPAESKKQRPETPVYQNLCDSVLNKFPQPWTTIVLDLGYTDLYLGSWTISHKLIKQIEEERSKWLEQQAEY